jgi:D,D-heptose 1,7-bisphosphate phosphatase
MLRQAVVLVGGLGTRLGELTARTPKPMLPVGNVPFLDILLKNIARHGITDVLLLSQHRADVIRAHYARNPLPGVKVTVCEEQGPAGTAGALREAAALLDDVFLLTNGDSLFDLNYLALHQGFDPSTTDFSIALCEVPDVSRYGQVTLGTDERVVGYAEKNTSDQPGLISGGVYIVSRRILDEIGSGMVSLETEVVPRLVARGRVTGRAFKGYFIDIGLPESYAQAQVEIPAWDLRPVVFLDRDGTINRDDGYTHRPEDLVFLPHVPEAIRAMNDAGRLVIVISNQAGIARGYYGPEQVDLFHEAINAKLQPFGAHIDAFYYCPHHPEGVVPELTRNCNCRKPGTALFEQACSQWSVDLGRSVMVGDMESDMLAAQNYGLTGIRTTGRDMNELIKRILT